ncbi:VIT domain-containing protein [Sebaldella termitidis]|uniref:VIT domain-containing protein n=1 Tax=Sebaldella termitidis TaxID=826 RepID=UPI003EB94B1B
MKKIFFMIIFIFGLMSADEISPGEGIRMPETGTAVLKANGEKEIMLDSMKISAEIKGNISTTTYELTFYNPNNRILEGEFEFPLLNGQTVTGYALDINGKMRDGVVVEKEKARQTFEAVERQNIDPGILEKTKGNNYKTRIYPIPANGYRKIRIMYEEILPKENGSVIYYLPLNYKNKVKDFSLEIKVPEQELKPEFISKISNMEFDNLKTGYYAEINKKDFMPDQSIKFYIKSDNKEKVYTERKGNEAYFLSSFSVNSGVKERKKSKKITLVWDTSNSGNNRNISEEIKFLDLYFKYLDNVDVTLITFGNKVSDPKAYKVTQGEWNELKNTLEGLYYDGETRFQNLDFKKYKGDEIIFVTDGLLSYGKEREKQGKGPVVTVNSSKTADENYLRAAALQTSGKYIDLNTGDAEKALENMKSENYRLISYNYNKNDIAEVYPPVWEGNSDDFSFAGKMKKTKAEITVNFGYGNVITETRKVFINSIEKNDGVSRLWAGKKIEGLSKDYENNRDEIVKTAKEYGIVTDDTTLIVLDRIDDYVKYEIVPPAELQEEYFKLTENVKKEKVNQKKEALTESVQILGEIKKWYVKDFSVKADKDKVKTNVISGNVSAAGSNLAKQGAIDSQVVAIESVKMLSIREVGVSSVGSVVNHGTVFSEGASVGLELIGNGDSLEWSIGTDKEEKSRIKVKAWSPDEVYLKELEKTPREQIMAKYFELKKEYSNQPSFFIDIADFMLKNEMKDEAVQILSNVSEMKLESPELLKTYGYKLLELNKAAEAVEVFKELVKIKGEDPQSYRDLAMAYEKNNNYQEALDTYYIVLSRSWDGRFTQIKDVVLKEMNRLIAVHSKLNISKIDKKLIYPMPLDIRVTLEWTADNSDIDLHFTDPFNETGYYGNRLTKIGSRLSGDITQGFGPEEFALKKAPDGTYAVKAKYFGDSRQNLAGPITLRVVMYTNYGTKKEKSEEIMVRVKDRKEMLEIGELIFKN